MLHKTNRKTVSNRKVCYFFSANLKIKRLAENSQYKCKNNRDRMKLWKNLNFRNYYGKVEKNGYF